MVGQTDFNSFYTEHSLAYMRADLALSSPQSYSLDEMREITDDISRLTSISDDAMREDFQSMPIKAQVRMLDLLKEADPSYYDEWLDRLMSIPA